MATPTKPQRDTEDAQFDVQAQLKLERTHDIIDRPEKFAAHFRNVARSQTDIKRVIIEIIRECLESDVDARKQFKNMIREVESENWKAFLKTTWGRIALGLWTLVVIAVTAFAEAWFNSHFRGA